MINITIKLDEHDILKIKNNAELISNWKIPVSEEDMESLRDHQARIYWIIEREVRTYCEKKGA